MQELINYLDMGGYAAYVWPAYGLTLVLLIALFFVTRWSIRNHERSLKALDSQDQGNAQ